MFDNTNPYTLKEITDGEKTIYIAVFKNGNGDTVETEISEEVSNVLFETFVKKERNLKRSDQRHLEMRELSETILEKEIKNIPLSVEEEIFRKIERENLYKAISMLSAIQRRRFILYYFKDYTFEQIGNMENCTKTRAKKSVDLAFVQIKKFFQK